MSAQAVTLSRCAPAPRPAEPRDDERSFAVWIGLAVLAATGCSAGTRTATKENLALTVPAPTPAPSTVTTGPAPTTTPVAELGRRYLAIVAPVNAATLAYNDSLDTNDKAKLPGRLKTGPMHSQRSAAPCCEWVSTGKPSLMPERWSQETHRSSVRSKASPTTEPPPKTSGTQSAQMPTRRAPMQTCSTLTLVSHRHPTSANPRPLSQGPSFPTRVAALTRLRAGSSGPGSSISAAAPRTDAASLRRPIDGPNEWILELGLHHLESVVLPDVVPTMRTSLGYRSPSTREARHSAGGARVAAGLQLRKELRPISLVEPTGEQRVDEPVERHRVRAEYPILQHLVEGGAHLGLGAGRSNAKPPRPAAPPSRRSSFRAVQVPPTAGSTPEACEPWLWFMAVNTDARWRTSPSEPAVTVVDGAAVLDGGLAPPTEALQPAKTTTTTATIAPLDNVTRRRTSPLCMFLP